MSDPGSRPRGEPGLTLIVIERRCGIPAMTLPPCDLPWGHDGERHANEGDGFYAREFEAEHRRRQEQRLKARAPAVALAEEKKQLETECEALRIDARAHRKRMDEAWFQYGLRTARLREIKAAETRLDQNEVRGK
jgi:hypothetical protein